VEIGELIGEGRTFASAFQIEPGKVKNVNPSEQLAVAAK
jgi:hypothetical protein